MASRISREVIRQIDGILELAASRAKETSDVEERRHYLRIIEIFSDIRSSIETGKLPPPGSGVGWGARRGMSDWNFNDLQMFKAVSALEQLYRDGR